MCYWKKHKYGNVRKRNITLNLLVVSNHISWELTPSAFVKQRCSVVGVKEKTQAPIQIYTVAD